MCVRPCVAAMFGFELGQLKGMVPVRAAETDLSLSPLPCAVFRHMGPWVPVLLQPHSATPYSIIPLFCMWGSKQPPGAFPAFLLYSLLLTPGSSAETALSYLPSAWTALPPLTHFPTPALAPVCELSLVNLVLGGVPATCLMPSGLTATLGAPCHLSVQLQGPPHPITLRVPPKDGGWGWGRQPCPASHRSPMPGTLGILPLPPKTRGPSQRFLCTWDQSAEQGHIDEALSPQQL